MGGELVLVTGGSGFIGAHCIVQLLNAGYAVRTTVRNLKRSDEVRAMVKAGGAPAEDKLSFATADLLSDAGWADAVKDCDYVLHVASPFPLSVPKSDDELIVPAREGTLRVLRAARDAKVKRVVLTSSFAAIGYGHSDLGRPFNENDWTDTKNGDMTAYVKSKAIAEKAAWDFIETEGGSLELSVVNPVGVFGPVLGSDYSTSVKILERLMDGSMPGCPQITFGVVDVRDVADLHLKAMTAPQAKNERFLAVTEHFISIQESGQVLRARLGDKASKVPTRILPDWLLKVIALFDPSVRQILPELGKKKEATNEKARRILGWTPRTREEAIVSSAESLLAFKSS
jgi:nucleoside-diphosphate-sugar epimerase